MFDIGFAELCLISAIALLVLGPERLPMALYVLGRWIAKWRRSFNELRDEFERQAGSEIRQLGQLPTTSWRNPLDTDILSPKAAAERRGDGEDERGQPSPPPPGAEPPSN